jgi:hypothetical protein
MNQERIRKARRRLRDALRISLLLLAGFGVGVLATRERPPRNTERELNAARDSVWYAWFANDTSVLHRLLPDAMVATDRRSASGNVEWNDRTAVLDSAQAFERSGARLVTLRFWNTRMSMIASLGVVRGDFEYVIERRGERRGRRGHTTAVFVPEGKRWANVLWYREDAPD